MKETPETRKKLDDLTNLVDALLREILPATKILTKEERIEKAKKLLLGETPQLEDKSSGGGHSSMTTDRGTPLLYLMVGSAFVMLADLIILWA